MLGVELQTLAVSATVTNIAFLSFSSQLLFAHIGPGPPSRREAAIFNVLIAGLLVCFARACLTDAGSIVRMKSEQQHESTQLWCAKCDGPKPPRSHHCRVCKRCIAKMDHHCPWIANCVGHQNFPHFLRFLFYSVITMALLMTHLYVRVADIWHHRSMPSTQGPAVFQLTHLFTLCLVNFISLFALSVLLMSSLWALGANVYTIEGYEIERHEVLLRRARRNGGFLYNTDGSRIRLVRQEFPYDIGIFANICQGMGSRNPLSWFWPLAASPALESGLQFETNGFENVGDIWPPPDPDRMANRQGAGSNVRDGSVQRDHPLLTGGKGFELRQRQHQDAERSRTFAEQPKLAGPGAYSVQAESLADLGVDEQAEYDYHDYSSDDPS